MPSKKTPDVAFPGAAESDLVSVASVRSAFERERPAGPSRVPGTSPPPRPTPEQLLQMKRFAVFVRSALAGLFGQQPATEPRAFSSWSEVQRQVLLEIAATQPHLHLNCGDLNAILLALGAMNVGAADDDRHLARYVGSRSHSPLEQEVDGQPIWLWLRRRLMGAVTREQWVQKASALDDEGRIALCRRVRDNAYQLMRRYPFPLVTRDQERDDAAQLSAELSPLLEAASTDALQAAVNREAAAPAPVDELVVDLVLSLVRRKAAVPGSAWARVASAMSLSTSEASLRSLLDLLPVAQRETVLRSRPLTAHNVQVWVHLDTVPAETAGSLVIAAVRDFASTIHSDVAVWLRRCVTRLPEAQRNALREIAKAGGPNQKVLDEALAAVN